jgi:hypothetical protein
MSAKELIGTAREVVSLSSLILSMWITASPSLTLFELRFFEIWQTTPQVIPSELKIATPGLINASD